MQNLDINNLTPGFTNYVSPIQGIRTLVAVRAALGRRYKAEIRNAWFDGGYRARGLEQWASELQEIRNQLGPSWLCDVRLPKRA